MVEFCHCIFNRKYTDGNILNYVWLYLTFLLFQSVVLIHMLCFDGVCDSFPICLCMEAFRDSIRFKRTGQIVVLQPRDPCTTFILHTYQPSSLIMIIMIFVMIVWNYLQQLTHCQILQQQNKKIAFQSWSYQECSMENHSYQTLLLTRRPMSLQRWISKKWAK